MDRGRGNHLVELKAYSDTAHAAFTKRGVACDTHAFPHEENLIRSVRGVAARPGDMPGERPWDRTEGVGRVETHLGAYDDAIRAKPRGRQPFAVEDEALGLYALPQASGGAVQALPGAESKVLTSSHDAARMAPCSRVEKR